MAALSAPPAPPVISELTSRFSHGVVVADDFYASTFTIACALLVPLIAFLKIHILQLISVVFLVFGRCYDAIDFPLSSY